MLLTFSNVIVLNKGLLWQDWVFRLGLYYIQTCTVFSSCSFGVAQYACYCEGFG